MQLGQRILCLIEPRDTWEGRLLRHSIPALIGQEVFLQPLWQMGPGHPHPGEWALGDAYHSEMALLSAGIPWIASGDVVILSIEEPREFPHSDG